MSCLFCRIVVGEIPAAKVYEDDELLAFKDIHPKAPLHLLIIPKEHIESMAALEDRHAPLMGRMMVLAQRLAAENGSPEGFRTVVNTGRVGRQEVYHLHMHLLGGPEPLGSSASF
ncbi:MAG: histidine triad nucleotide-binding protein [Betaproteobacteria bacterium]|nr:histidine triad nucleotide-binding protein [Betaproteobacteria bacterium]